MPLSFLAPLALAALGLVAAPIVIHMLRRSKSKRLDFPNLRFLRETPSLVRRLTPPNRRWLLALRCLVIALIALAAARPAWTGAGADDGSAVVVLIDASASMARSEAKDGALSAAREVIGRLGPSDLVCVAQFDRRVTWLATPGTPVEALAALSAYAPGLSTADPSVAFAAAEQQLATTPRANRRIVVLSDFQRANGPWAIGSADTFAAIEPIRIENAFDNAFVAEASLEAGPDGERAACSVVRAGSKQRVAGRVVIPLADGAATEGLVVTRDTASWTIRVTDADEFDLDDVRNGVVASRGSVVVCDPGAGLPFLVAAARVNEGETRVSSIPRIDAAGLAGASVAIVSSRALDVAGATSALETFVRGGGAAVVFAASALSATASVPNVADAPSSPTSVSLAVSPSESAAIALRSSPLRAGTVEATGDDAVLARDGEGHAVVVRRILGMGTITVAGFDVTPDAGKLVFDGGFPDVVRVLTEDPGTAELDVGDTLTGLALDAIVEAGGHRLAVQSNGSVRIDAPGVIRVTSASGTQVFVANVSARESEPGQLASGEVAALARSATNAGDTVATARAAAEERWPIWRLLLVLALVAAFVELAYISTARVRATERPRLPADEIEPA